MSVRIVIDKDRTKKISVEDPMNVKLSGQTGVKYLKIDEFEISAQNRIGSKQTKDLNKIGITVAENGFLNIEDLQIKDDQTARNLADRKQVYDNDQNVRVALVEAFKKDDVTAVKAILQQLKNGSEKRDINKTLKSGATILHYACKQQAIKSVICLIEHGADISLEIETPTKRVKPLAFINNEKIATEIELFSKSLIFSKAALNDDEKQMAEMLKQDMAVISRVFHFEGRTTTPLHFVCEQCEQTKDDGKILSEQQRERKAIKFLIENGSDSSIKAGKEDKEALEYLGNTKFARTMKRLAKEPTVQSKRVAATQLPNLNSCIFVASSYDQASFSKVIPEGSSDLKDKKDVKESIDLVSNNKSTQNAIQTTTESKKDHDKVSIEDVQKNGDHTHQNQEFFDKLLKESNLDGIAYNTKHCDKTFKFSNGAVKQGFNFLTCVNAGSATFEIQLDKLDDLTANIIRIGIKIPGGNYIFTLFTLYKPKDYVFFVQSSNIEGPSCIDYAIVKANDNDLASIPRNYNAWLANPNDQWVQRENKYCWMHPNQEQMQKAALESLSSANIKLEKGIDSTLTLNGQQYFGSHYHFISNDKKIVMKFTGDSLKTQSRALVGINNPGEPYIFPLFQIEKPAGYDFFLKHYNEGKNNQPSAAIVGVYKTNTLFDQLQINFGCDSSYIWLENAKCRVDSPKMVEELPTSASNNKPQVAETAQPNNPPLLRQFNSTANANAHKGFDKVSDKNFNNSCIVDSSPAITKSTITKTETKTCHEEISMLELKNRIENLQLSDVLTDEDIQSFKDLQISFTRGTTDSGFIVTEYSIKANQGIMVGLNKNIGTPQAEGEFLIGVKGSHHRIMPLFHIHTEKRHDLAPLEMNSYGKPAHFKLRVTSFPEKLPESEFQKYASRARSSAPNRQQYLNCNEQDKWIALTTVPSRSHSPKRKI